MLPFDETIRRADRECLALADIASEELRARFLELWKQVKVKSAKSSPEASPRQGVAGECLSEGREWIPEAIAC